MTKLKNYRRDRIRKRIRKIIAGSPDYPRLSVFRSNKDIYCQIIDDVNGKTVISLSSRDKEIIDLKLKSNIEKSFNVGKLIAEKAIKESADSQDRIKQELNEARQEGQKLMAQAKEIADRYRDEEMEKIKHEIQALA